MEIQKLDSNHLRSGFLETLASLAETNLTFDQAYTVFYDRSLCPNIHTFVAISHNIVCGDVKVPNVVGTATLITERKFLHGGKRAAHIEDVAVHQDWQGQGIGKELIEHLLQQARVLGCYKVVLHCKPELIPYYNKFGFREWAEGMRIDF
jgi:glucosamine-phosphate N-acetyltransferase